MTDAIVTDTDSLWGTPLQAAGCPKCKSVFLLVSDKTTSTCPNCFAATLTPQPARLHTAPPELYLPFALASIHGWRTPGYGQTNSIHNHCAPD
jgi:hypothetical protein